MSQNFNIIYQYCRKDDINESIIKNVRCQSVLITQDLETTRPYDERIRKLINFMIENNQIVIVNVDKSVYVAILLKNDYHDKLSKVFDNKENFEKIQRR
jgi:hypothetical protein